MSVLFVCLPTSILCCQLSSNFILSTKVACERPRNQACHSQRCRAQCCPPQTKVYYSSRHIRGPNRYARFVPFSCAILLTQRGGRSIGYDYTFVPNNAIADADNRRLAERVSMAFSRVPRHGKR